MAKKPKIEETFSPEQLEKLENQGDLDVQRQRNERLFDRFHARRDSKSISREVRWKRRAGVALVICALVLLLLWIISMLWVKTGDLVISVDNGAARAGILISESEEPFDGRVTLSADKVIEVTNITYDWLPTDLDEQGSGSHNGKNYLAYTFYIKNNANDRDGSVFFQDNTSDANKTVALESTMTVTGAAKSADEALRVMIYRDGQPTVYAKKNPNGEALESVVNFEFVDDTVVFNDKLEDFKPGDTHKYTVVTWIEGNDPECIDEIMGGFVKLQWSFKVAGEDL